VDWPLQMSVFLAQRRMLDAALHWNSGGAMLANAGSWGTALAITCQLSTA